MLRKSIFRSVVLAVFIGALVGSGTPGQGGSAPQITFLSFDAEIKADGNPVLGFVGFKDPDGDIIIRAEFDVVQAADFQPFSFDPDVKGVKEGVFEFALATKVPQRMTLRLTLVDEAGNRSQPKDFSFEAVAPILRVTPTSLSFSEQVGHTPVSQTIQITNAGRGTINWIASADQPWIGLSPQQGVAPATVTVSINTAELDVGSYAGRITVEAPGAYGSPVVIQLNLTLTPVPLAMLEVSPEKLEFRGQEGVGNLASQPVTIRNVGGQALTWTAQANASWLNLDRTTGTLQAGEKVEVQISVSLVGLSAGTRQAQIIITAPEARNSPVTVNVTLVLEARPLFTVCPSGCPFTKIQPAIDAARSGDTITVGPGTYYENLSVTKSLTLEGAGRVTISSAGANPAVFILNTRNVTIKGFTITGGRHGIVIQSVSRIAIVNNVIQNNAGKGLLVLNSSEMEVTENKIEGQTDPGCMWSAREGPSRCRSGLTTNIFGGGAQMQDSEGITLISPGPLPARGRGAFPLPFREGG